MSSDAEGAELETNSRSSPRVSLTDAASRRMIAPGIHWLVGCAPATVDGQVIHGHMSSFLVLGAEKALMYDTGGPQDWAIVQQSLREILGGRPLDFIVPSHSELPHAGNLARLVRHYPSVRVLGDVRDYHLFYPLIADRLASWPKHRPVDLGGGYTFTLVEAPIRDLDSTQWGYESSQRVLFVSDGFSYMHDGPAYGLDEPAHAPGECSLLSTELRGPLRLERAVFLAFAALYWARFLDASGLFDQFEELVRRYPTRLVAPAHGNVIDDLGGIMPLMRQALEVVLEQSVAREREVLGREAPTFIG